MQNKDAARLMGIDVRVASRFRSPFDGARGLAGLLIAPLFSVIPTWARCSASRLSRSRSSAASPQRWGVMLAGLLYGLIEALVTAFFGSTYTQIVVFALVIVALAADCRTGCSAAPQSTRYDMRMLRAGRQRR